MLANYMFLKQQRDVKLVRRLHHKPQTLWAQDILTTP